MSDAVDALILDLLEWVGPRPRPYSEVIEAWRTSCPRLPVWEDANERGFVECRHLEERGVVVSVTALGREFLDRHRPHRPGLLFELFEDTPRQGPGSVETTRRALRSLPASLQAERVLDLGCGTGGSTLVLARDTGAHVTAVDIHPPFLATLRARAEEQGLADRITTVAADMAEPASLGAGFDLIWAEGSAYSIGFENALCRWRPLLRPGGCLVVTELVWFVAEPAEHARAFFAAEYPDMRDEATRIEQARSACYDVLGSFRLPAADWHAYYAGLEAPLRDAIARRGELEIYAALRRERAIYEACGDDYGYLCLILQVAAGP